MTDPGTPRPNAPETEDSSVADAAYVAGQEAAHNKWLLVIVGIVTLIGGFLAIAMPLVASFTAALVMAWVLIGSGIVGAITALRRNHGWHMLATFLTAALSVLIGVMILVQPVIGLISITALIIVFFAISGVMRIYFGVQQLGDGVGGGWMIAGGVLSLILVVMLITGLPFTAAWVPGVLLGIDLTIWGAILIAISTRASQLAAARDVAQSAS